MRLYKMGCFCAFFRVFALFCAFLRVFPYQDGLQKSTYLRRILQNCAKKTLLCNTPFSYTPFCVSPKNHTKTNYHS